MDHENKQEVRTFTWQMAKALQRMNIKMLVIACNTATAVALESLQQKYANTCNRSH